MAEDEQRDELARQQRDAVAHRQRNALAHSIDVLEESYELFLAYAAQGSPGTGAGTGDGRARAALERSCDALEGLAGGFAHHLEQCGLAERHRDFLAVLERDAAAARAVIELVRAQSRISSQLIDNLNASLHLRTLLTDLFLIDQILQLTEAARESEGAVERS
ncbi:MAG TPA: hypothetical protein VMT85_10620 [Thermoanaerobaculia bacterium]|nr:hypothetical protein [Thermoanaerobaculia bacterium]